MNAIAKVYANAIAKVYANARNAIAEVYANARKERKRTQLGLDPWPRVTVSLVR